VEARSLEKVGLVHWFGTADGTLHFRSTYKGLVWETRRGYTVQSRTIDELVREWETTSVDFKQELHVDTASEKAELVKDVIALANTQASGRRWLVLGFENKTRAYYGPPDPKVTPDRLEQLLAEYVTPAVDIRYEVYDYRAGPVGMLEILRDPKKLPYAVKRAVGGPHGQRGEKHVEEGQVFVRHGSHTAEASEEERRALDEEREWAQGRPPRSARPDGKSRSRRARERTDGTR